MALPLSDLVLDFIADLRSAGIRISVAESLDAMHAIARAGLAQSHLREALRASLIKDARDDGKFDERFAAWFQKSSQHEQRLSRGSRVGVSGSGKGDNSAAAIERSERPQKASSGKAPNDDEIVETGASVEKSSQTDSGKASAIGQIHNENENVITVGDRSAPTPKRGSDNHRESAISRTPFANYSPVEFEQAREALAWLERRFRTRAGRRMRVARRGRIDLRRTLHASIQRGGLPLDLRFRRCRPRHLELVALADISGSVHYAAELMVELLAGARDYFRRVRTFVFIDQPAEADFERGHLVMTPPLDRFARSDFGRVLGLLHDHHGGLFNPATVMVIMGDGRNNRRPARADLLRAIARRCRAVIWLNPEPIGRWETGDSAIGSYRKAVDALLPCGNLRELEYGLNRLL